MRLLLDTRFSLTIIIYAPNFATNNFCLSLFCFRIAAEQREAERKRRECILREKAIALTKKKYKEESTQVMLGVSYDYYWVYFVYQIVCCTYVHLIHLLLWGLYNNKNDYNEIGTRSNFQRINCSSNARVSQ